LFKARSKNSTSSRSKFSKSPSNSKRESFVSAKKFTKKSSTPFSQKDSGSSSDAPRSPRSIGARSRTPFVRSERTDRKSTPYSKPFTRSEDSSGDAPRSPRGAASRSRTPYERTERTDRKSTPYSKPFARSEDSSGDAPRSPRGAASRSPRSSGSSGPRSRTPFVRSERTDRKSTPYSKPFSSSEEGASSSAPRVRRTTSTRSETPFQRPERTSATYEKSPRRSGASYETSEPRIRKSPVKISKGDTDFVDEDSKEKRSYVKSTPGQRYSSRKSTPIKKRKAFTKTSLTTKGKVAVTSLLENAPIRLNKYIADGGVASRRTADELISTGKVTVNGAIVIDLGTRVTKTDLVAVNGEPVSFQKHLTYILLNKPKDVITTVSDELKRKTVFDIVKIHSRLFPVGRLDRNTTGALLLTNDGELAYRLTHPKFEVPREYIVKVDKKISLEDAKKISDGLELEDGLTSPCIIFVDPIDKHKARLEIKEGKNREVRRMFEFLGYDVKSLDRKSYSFLTTKGLDRGQYRHLTRYEIDRLRTILGLEDTLY
jgi:23S rRNA pseudouridine2605 synthase